MKWGFIESFKTLEYIKRKSKHFANIYRLDDGEKLFALFGGSGKISILLLLSWFTIA